MKKLIIIIILAVLPNLIKSQVYIDPSAKTNGNGTLSSPYNTLPTIKANTAYLFKCGTTYLHSNVIDIQVTGVTLGSYGTGEKPIIKVTSSSNNIQGVGSLTVKDLELVQPLNTNDNNADNALGFRPGNGYLTVTNCKIHGGYAGISVDNYYTNNKAIDVKITNCEIYDTWSDAIFCNSGTSLEVSNCKIYNVNLSEGKGVSDGDCIHLDDYKTVRIHDNILDHTTKAGKFCLLVGSNSNTFVGNVIIENNTMFRTRGGTDNTIFYSNYGHGSTFIFRNNTCYGALQCLQSRTYDMQIYNNVISNVNQFIELNAPYDYDSYAKIYNNTISNVGQVLYGNGEYVDLNHNLISNVTGQAFVCESNVTSNYNNFWNIIKLGDLTKGKTDLSLDPSLSSNITALSGIGANAVIAPPSPTYTLTSSAGAGGIISPTVTVNKGVSQTFTITPNNGYQVASVLVDNASVGIVLNYTFSNVTANHTISATFSQVIINDPCKSARDSVKTAQSTITLLNGQVKAYKDTLITVRLDKQTCVKNNINLLDSLTKYKDQYNLSRLTIIQKTDSIATLKKKIFDIKQIVNQ